MAAQDEIIKTEIDGDEEQRAALPGAQRGKKCEIGCRAALPENPGIGFTESALKGAIDRYKEIGALESEKKQGRVRAVRAVENEAAAGAILAR